jgi:hypothetical protein
MLKDPDDLARRAALRLGAEMDPALPRCVDTILRESPGTAPDDLVRGGTLGAFIVACCHVGCGIDAENRRRTERPSALWLADQLRREMGIDEGMSHDHDAVIDAVVHVLSADAKG